MISVRANPVNRRSEGIVGRKRTDSATVGPALPELVEEFLIEKESTGARPRTLQQYGYSLRLRFLPFCEREGIERADQLETPVLHRLQAELQRTGNKANTVRAYMDPVRFFISWANARDYEVPGVIAKVKVRPSPIVILEMDELERMEDAASHQRDQLIIAVLRHTAMRVGELVSLRHSDLYTEGRQAYLRVNGKTGPREVPVGGDLRRRLERYMTAYGPHKAEDYIFVGVRLNRSGFYERLTDNSVERIVRDAARFAGIRKRVHPHLIRHSVITDWLRHGMNDFQVSKIAGNFSHLAIYAHLEKEDAAAALIRYQSARR